MKSNAEQTEAAQPVTEAAPKARKKANAGARRANVASAKPKPGKKASPAKKAPKPREGEKNSDSARDGSKTAKIIELLKRPGGATTQELMKVTGWLPHSVRGFLSGTLRKKMGIAIASAKRDDQQRVYSID